MSSFDADGFLYVVLDTPLSVGGEDYNMRLTRTSPGRTNPDDQITLQIDYQRVSDLDSGRFEDQVFEARQGQQSVPFLQGKFQSMLNNDTPVPSPVYG